MAEAGIAVMRASGVATRAPDPPAAMAERVSASAWQLHRYPRLPLAEATEAVAGFLGVDAGHVLLMVCAEEAADLVLTLGRRGWSVRPGAVVPYRVASRRIPLREIALGEDGHPVPPPGDLGRDDVVLLAQPASPAGGFLAPRWISAVRAAAGHVLVDETLQPFPSRSSMIGQACADERLIVYRGLSRALGLDGVRLGCLVGAPATIAVLAERRRFMAIDAVSLNAVTGLLSCPAEAREWLAEAQVH